MLVLVFSSCNLTKLVPPGKQLLVQNKIERGDKRGIDLSEETSNLKQKPNRKLLGFIRFHYGLISTVLKGWVSAKNKVGAAGWPKK